MLLVTLWRAILSEDVQLLNHTHRQYVSTSSMEQQQKAKQLLGRDDFFPEDFQYVNKSSY